MSLTPYFIKDRALSLSYESTVFTATSGVALAWLRLALKHACKNGQAELVKSLNTALNRAQSPCKGTRHVLRHALRS